MLRAALVLAVVTSLGGVPVAAQAPGPPAPFVTVDQERLFAESAFGRRAIAEIERRSRTLAAENRRIESELVAEERALTELRPTLEHAEFRAQAEAFDEKVQRLRAEQDEKELEMSELRDQAQSVFFSRIGPVLGEVVRDRGAVAILDRRVVILAVESIDVTDAAIARINFILGDGAGLWPTEGAAEDGGAQASGAAPAESAESPLAGSRPGIPAQPLGAPPYPIGAPAPDAEPGDASSAPDGSARQPGEAAPAATSDGSDAGESGAAAD